MWGMDHIIIVKKSDMSGEASIKFTDEDGTTLFVNKISIDLSLGANSVGVARIEGTGVVSGGAIDDAKDVILDLFQNDLQDKEPGIYRADVNGIERV